MGQALRERSRYAVLLPYVVAAGRAVHHVVDTWAELCSSGVGQQLVVLAGWLAVAHRKYRSNVSVDSETSLGARASGMAALLADARTSAVGHDSIGLRIVLDAAVASSLWEKQVVDVVVVLLLKGDDSLVGS